VSTEIAVLRQKAAQNDALYGVVRDVLRRKSDFFDPGYGGEARLDRYLGLNVGGDHDPKTRPIHDGSGEPAVTR